MSDLKYSFIDKALSDRSQQHNLRQLKELIPLSQGKVKLNDQILLNFSGNDYLGLSQDPQVIAGAKEYSDRYGAGSGASRLVTGNYEIHSQLERQFATFLHREAALLFNSGFQANITLLPTLFDRHSLILSDRYSHRSLLQGIRLSQAKFIRYRHNDLNHLKQILEQHKSQTYNRIGIVTETIFSMDGDSAPLAELVDLAGYYGAWLYLDDAHGVGVLGEQGQGMAAPFSTVDVVIITLGKAFGSFGAVVGCRQKLKDYWINTCPGFIYTTALPPAVIGAVQTALQRMPHLDSHRAYLFQQAQRLHQFLQTLPCQTSPTPSHILPLVLGDPAAVLNLEQQLKYQGILAAAIRTPTVPLGSDRIRLTCSSAHPPEHYQQLIQAIGLNIFPQIAESPVEM